MSHTLVEKIKQWGLELGFQQVGIADTQLNDAENHLHHWLDKGFHGELDYMAKHGLKRSRPALLHPNTQSIISVRMDYLPEHATAMNAALNSPTSAYISRYALGRDYHKLMRQRLQKLADKIQAEIGEFGYRAFVDSAPVLEKAIAQKAGLGWIGKHSNLINKTSLHEAFIISNGWIKYSSLVLRTHTVEAIICCHDQYTKHTIQYNTTQYHNTKRE
jgi:epoxyqueuosine reductase